MVLELIRRLIEECSPDEVYYFDEEIVHPDDFMDAIIIWGVLVSNEYVYAEINAGEWMRLQGNEEYLDAILSKLLAYKQWLTCLYCN